MNRPDITIRADTDEGQEAMVTVRELITQRLGYFADPSDDQLEVNLWISTLRDVVEELLAADEDAAYTQLMYLVHTLTTTAAWAFWAGWSSGHPDDPSPDPSDVRQWAAEMLDLGIEQGWMIDG